MKSQATIPAPQEIVHSLQAIRAHWSNAKRTERRQLAKAKQRQLVRCLATGRTACQGGC